MRFQTASHFFCKFVGSFIKMKKTALHEVDGIPAPKIVSSVSAAKIKNLRKVIPTATSLIDGILSGDKTALSRAITLIESTNNKHTTTANQVINACLPYANKSVRIGITGVPGVGKSTFIEVFGKYLTSLGKNVVILAVDPSSSISNGSILGDKTRMEELSKDANAFIRPSATGTTLGGVARKTRETIILCEAAKYDVVIIETVGVGQSETAVHSMVDFFLLLGLAGAGDGLQGIKRGIMEMADLLVINKADGDNETKARLASADSQRTLHYFAMKKSGWTPQATTCSALENIGITNIWKIVSDYFTLTKSNNYFDANRNEQNEFWLVESINEALKAKFYNDPNIISVLDQKISDVKNGVASPFEIAQVLVNQHYEKGS